MQGFVEEERFGCLKQRKACWQKRDGWVRMEFGLGVLKDEGGRKETGRGIKERTEMRSSQLSVGDTEISSAHPLMAPRFHFSFIIHRVIKTPNKKVERRGIFTAQSLEGLTWSFD